jgi:tRNA-binding EMAP/Myf-like protein
MNEFIDDKGYTPVTLPEISISDFLKVDIRVGQILEVIENKKSR